MSSFSWIDYTVVALYLAGTIAIGLAIGRRITTGHDYFLAGRRLRWWVIGMSLVATDIGGTDIIGVGGAAYKYGLAVGNFEWIGCVPAMIIAAFIFIPYFWRSGVYTIPEFMEKRFNAGVRSSLALCWLLFMASNVGIMLYASATMFVTAFGIQFDVGLLAGHEITICLLATAAFVGVYTLAGGLAAVVYTDTIQCVVMIGGCALVLVLGIVEVGGVGELIQRVQELEHTRAAATASAATVSEHTSLILPVDTKSPFPWPAILIGLGMILSPAYWIGNQAIAQRSLGARSEYEAKASYIFGALLKNLIPLIIAVPGLIAFVCFPDLEQADAAFPTLVTRMLPVGVKGLFLAAFAAALMSSIDSYLNSAATILTNDVYRRFIHRNADERVILRVGRITTLALLVWGIGFGIYISRLEGTGIYTIFQTLMAFFQGPAFALLLTGLLWRRATGAGAMVGFIGGVLTSVLLFAMNQDAVYTWFGLEPLFKVEEPFLYFSIWAFLVAMLLIIVVSLLTRPEPDEKIRGLMYRRTEAAK